MNPKIIAVFIGLVVSICAFAQTSPERSPNSIGGEACNIEGAQVITIPAFECQNKGLLPSQCTLCAYCGDPFLITSDPLNETCEKNQFINDNVNNNSCRTAGKSKCTYCGDNRLQTQDANEECDNGDANSNSPNACRVNCQLPECGDNIIDNGPDFGEECDGNAPIPAEKSCRNSTCKFRACGDGYLDTDLQETCDQTDFLYPPVNGNLCRNAAADIDLRCTYCGDGIKQKVEICDGSDKGDVTDNDALCNIDCSGFFPYCGDGISGNTAGETCDDGNQLDDDTCRNNCTKCGDGILDSGEVCDPLIAEGSAGFNILCSTSCQITAGCGNGTSEAGESCDDGDTDDSDSCRNDCTKCGDAALNGNEQCESSGGSLIYSEAASGYADKVCNPATCMISYCGDGTLQSPAEKCDPAIPAGSPGYNANCRSDCGFCGDGVKNGSEQCEPGVTQMTEYRQCKNDCMGYCPNNKPAVAIDFNPTGGDWRSAKCNGSSYDNCSCSNALDTCVIWGYGYASAEGTIYYCDSCGTDSCGRTCTDDNFGNTNCCVGSNPPAEDGNIVIWYDYEAIRTCIMGAHYRDERDIGDANYDPGAKWAGDARNYYGFQFTTDSFYLKASQLYGYTTQQAMHGLVAENSLPAWSPQYEYLNYNFTHYNRYGQLISNPGAQLANVCWTCAYVRRLGCFVPESRIKLADGSYKMIKDITADDLVWNPVLKIAQRISHIIESDEKLPIIEISTEVGSLKITQQHPLETSNGIRPANQITLADKILGGDGELHQITAIREMPLKADQKVVNFVVEGADSEFASHMIEAEGLVSGDLYVQQKLHKQLND